MRKGRACACGCGGTTSTPQTEYKLGHRPKVPLRKRLARHILVGDPTECWVWTSGKARNGYGTVGIDGKTHVVHRIVYETFVGPIPDGLVIDHLCRNRLCVNPDHLEAVTVAENVRRADPFGDYYARRRAITHCPKGHPYDDANTYHSATGSRVCRTCGRAASLAHYYRKRGAVA